MKLSPEFHVFSEYKREAIVKAMERWLSEDPHPTAIFSGDDQFVPEVYTALQAKGLRIPQDVAVLGRGNMSLGTTVVPQLTTINIPSFQLGQKAAELLLNLLHDPKHPLRKIILPCSLIERASV